MRAHGAIAPRGYNDAPFHVRWVLTREHAADTEPPTDEQLSYEDWGRSRAHASERPSERGSHVGKWVAVMAHGKVLVKVARLFMVALHALSPEAVRKPRAAGLHWRALLRPAPLARARARVNGPRAYTPMRQRVGAFIPLLDQLYFCALYPVSPSASHSSLLHHLLLPALISALVFFFLSFFLLTILPT